MYPFDSCYVTHSRFSASLYGKNQVILSSVLAASCDLKLYNVGVYRV